MYLYDIRVQWSQRACKRVLNVHNNGFFVKKTKKFIKIYINVMFKLDYIEKICYNTVVKGKM